MDKAILLKELQFKAVRSGGAGGQHVNKVSTKIELSFDLEGSNALSDLEKERIRLRLGARLTKENVLQLQCDESRSQHKNKDLAIIRLFDILENALKTNKKRKKTRPTLSAVVKRLDSKKKESQKKANRERPRWD